MSKKIISFTLKHQILMLVLCCYGMNIHCCQAQAPLKPLDSLIDRSNSGWLLVKDWIDSSTNLVTVLPKDSAKASAELYAAQISTRSPLGAIIYNSGGILVAKGWIRILGSGSKQLTRSLYQWNLHKTVEQMGQGAPFVLVADDAVGGFFAINGGGLGRDLGAIYYLSPDRLVWEPLDFTYSAFLQFCFSGDINGFYAGLRWKNWEKDFLKLKYDQAFQFYPFLWSKEGKDIQKNTRKKIPVEELYQFNITARRQLGLQ